VILVLFEGKMVRSFCEREDEGSNTVEGFVVV